MIPKFSDLIVVAILSSHLGGQYNLFGLLIDVRNMSQRWRWYYNTERHHKILDYLSPVKYAEKYAKDGIVSTHA